MIGKKHVLITIMDMLKQLKLGNISINIKELIKVTY